jgi:hypothetical protein
VEGALAKDLRGPHHVRKKPGAGRRLTPGPCASAAPCEKKNAPARDDHSGSEKSHCKCFSRLPSQINTSMVQNPAPEAEVYLYRSRYAESAPEVDNESSRRLGRVPAGEPGQRPEAGGLGWQPSVDLRTCSAVSAMGPLAGAGGFEPPNDGTKIRCLTTWRRPNADPI